MISATPILINVVVVPRFPPGPLANAEGMALRQLPVLFVALALVAWEYRMEHIVLFSVATATFELALIFFNAFAYQSIFVFIFIAIIRSISFIALGIFIKPAGHATASASRIIARGKCQSHALCVHVGAAYGESRTQSSRPRTAQDTLAHSLTALSVSLETVKAYFDIDKDKTRELIDRSLEATHQGVDETRRALKALRSSALEDLGLGLALQRAAESAATRFNLNLELTLPNPMPSLSPDVEQALYRIAQETLENLTTHSRAKKFSVQLTYNEHVT